MRVHPVNATQVLDLVVELGVAPDGVTFPRSDFLGWFWVKAERAEIVYHERRVSLFKVHQSVHDERLRQFVSGMYPTIQNDVIMPPSADAVRLCALRWHHDTDKRSILYLENAIAVRAEWRERKYLEGQFLFDILDFSTDIGGLPETMSD